MTVPSPILAELADACGVATTYTDWQDRPAQVSAETIRAVLAAMGIDATDDAAAATALHQVHERPWRRVLPPVVVLREGWTPWVTVHVPHGAPIAVDLTCEDGEVRAVSSVDRWVPPRFVDGLETGEATLELPADLPLGYHTLTVRYADGTATCPVIVTPHRVPLPPTLAERRQWGLMAQLYSVRSRRSWGVGDLADLAELATWGGELGAGFVLVNPLHAAEPTSPMTPSPYLPMTRRFVNPIYLRIEDIPEVGYLSLEARTRMEWLARPARALDHADMIDRDRAWRAKAQALKLIHAVPRSLQRESAYRAYCAAEGPGLDDFATWCALAEAYGPDTASWPAELADPQSDAVFREREQRADRVDFHRWLQWLLNDQLAAAQSAAETAGMGLGVMHDLAVGVHPNGADAWGLSDVLARGVGVGAPADQYNQLGQDWSSPPWRPDRLAEAGYAPYRDLLRTVLRHAGGLRIDHVIGLFRLWWVPQGFKPSEGTYVRYDHEALVGILALEAARAGAVVVGEDLGTVEPWVRDYLRDRQILGTSIVWFEKDYLDESGRRRTPGTEPPLPPERYRELCLATVTTHDLPPTWGYLQGAHIDLRDRLGLLTRGVAEERADAAQEQRDLIMALRERGLLDADAPDGELDPASITTGLHAWLAQTPALLIGVSVPDLVGDLRPMNQPGTDAEYPNWRFSLADDQGRVVLLEQLTAIPFARRIAEVVEATVEA